MTPATQDGQKNMPLATNVLLCDRFNWNLRNHTIKDALLFSSKQLPLWVRIAGIEQTLQNIQMVRFVMIQHLL